MKKFTCCFLSFLLFITPLLAQDLGTCVIYDDKALWSCYNNKSEKDCEFMNNIDNSKRHKWYGHTTFPYDCQDYCKGYITADKCGEIDGKYYSEDDGKSYSQHLQHKKMNSFEKFNLFEEGERLGVVGRTGVILLYIGGGSLALGGFMAAEGGQDQYEGDNEESSTAWFLNICLTVSLVTIPIGVVLYKLDGGKLGDFF